MAAASNGLAELTTSATTQTQPSPKINEQTKNLKNSFSGAPLTLLKNDVFKKTLLHVSHKSSQSVV
jgi:hypothetical protein